jgi:hypothetical protein
MRKKSKALAKPGKTCTLMKHISKIKTYQNYKQTFLILNKLKVRSKIFLLTLQLENRMFLVILQ